MIYTSREFERYSVAASDGPIGPVKDLYFNDHSLHVGYFVVETGSWLNSRRVLLTTQRLTPVPTAQWLTIDATREEVGNSPDVSTNLPLSCEHDQAVTDYFLPPAPSHGITDPCTMEREARTDDGGILEAGCLRSVRQVRGYQIMAQDGLVGEVQDLLVDVPRWQVRYFLVSTGGWLAHRSVLIALPWIASVQWDEAIVQVNLPREEVVDGPPYEPGAPVKAAYTERLVREFGPKHPPEISTSRQD